MLVGGVVDGLPTDASRWGNGSNSNSNKNNNNKSGVEVDGELSDGGLGARR